MRNYYADPTANTAIANVDRERRLAERRRREAERRAALREKGRLGDAGRKRADPNGRK